MTGPRVPDCSDERIWDVWLSAFHAPALAIADGLGLFAAMAEGATAEQLAGAIGVEVRAVETLAGLMVSLGFASQAEGRFHLLDVARTYLLPTSPYYWGPLLRRIRDIPIDCNKFIASLRSGTAAREARVSGEMWKAPSPPPEALIGFTRAMHAHSFALAMRVVRSFGLESVGTFLDVAAGSGSYSIAAALAYPQLRCTLLDLPVVSKVSREYVEQHGVLDRVDFVSLDMFSEPWPSGFDRVFMSDIFHDWDDEQCRYLAQRAHDALRPGGRILIHEMLLADTKDAPLAAAAYSMVMVFVTEGRQRTARELSEILTSAGFTSPTVTMTSGGYALISATK